MKPPLPGQDATARETLAAALVATGGEDRIAFRSVYTLTSAKLFGICLRICGERQAAEDVLHEVYLTIWKRAGGYEPGRSSPITWLATIARNRAIDWRRANQRRVTTAVDGLSAIVDDSPSVVDAMLHAEADSALYRCIEALEPRQRDAIRTAFFEGLSYSDLAMRGNIPLGTVKSWIRRGLIRLKDCLDDRA